MSDSPGWLVLAQFGARWEADLLVEALRAAKIPVLVEGGDTAIFGPGFGGGFSSNVVVKVPTEFQDYAVEIGSVFDSSLGVEPPGPSDDPEDPDTPEESR